MPVVRRNLKRVVLDSDDEDDLDLPKLRAQAPSSRSLKRARNEDPDDESVESRPFSETRRNDVAQAPSNTGANASQKTLTPLRRILPN